jgi:hypothetical protein
MSAPPTEASDLAPPPEAEAAPEAPPADAAPAEPAPVAPAAAPPDPYLLNRCEALLNEIRELCHPLRDAINFLARERDVRRTGAHPQAFGADAAGEARLVADLAAARDALREWHGRLTEIHWAHSPDHKPKAAAYR